MSISIYLLVIIYLGIVLITGMLENFLYRLELFSSFFTIIIPLIVS